MPSIKYGRVLANALQRRYTVRVVNGTKSAKSVETDDVRGPASQRLRARQMPLLELGECASTSPNNDSNMQHRRCMSPPKLLWLCGHLFRRIELQHHARSFRILLVQPFVIVKRKSPDFSGLFLFLLGGASRSRTGLNGFAGRRFTYKINNLYELTIHIDRSAARPSATMSRSCRSKRLGQYCSSIPPEKWLNRSDFALCQSHLDFDPATKPMGEKMTCAMPSRDRRSAVHSQHSQQQRSTYANTCSY